MSYLWLVLALLPVLGGAERFSCRGRILGAYYADAKSGCKAFHVCVRVAGGGIRDFRFFCPPGTLFHQEAQTCTDWGDDDPLACPADLYDGQFDLYKIGSGFDTKKLSSSSSNNREEESEFGLQRAETGDRRLSQNQPTPNNGPASDLRAAHSSDFFSGQRERGRDEQAPPSPSAPSRQSFRRPTSPKTSPNPTQYTTTSVPPSRPIQHSKSQNYDGATKRKLVRKRPVYVSTTQSTTTYTQSSQQPRQPFSEPANNNYENYPTYRPSSTEKPKSADLFNVVPANIPPQFKEYKDEYVEVSRVTPKQNKYFISQSSTPSSRSTPTQSFSKKEGLTELYNYDAQSTPGLNVRNENKPFKVRNNFNVAPELPQNRDVARNNVNVVHNGARASSITPSEYSSSTRNFATSTPAYKNFNSVSYEPEKIKTSQFSGGKQNYFNSPTPTAASFSTTTRSDPPQNFNTVAHNTNIGFNAQPINYVESEEDDGQYRPPAGEDDGQYRPELYERELLSGAHSLNIAASGNRLPDDQKPRPKPQQAVSQTAAPRPFRPAPTPSSTPNPTTRAPEPTYTTTYRPQTASTQRNFDFFQTYTTTSKPIEQSAPVQVSFNFAPVRQVTTSEATRIAELRPLAPESRPRTSEPRPQAPEPRPQTAEPRPQSPRAPLPPTAAPARPTTRPPHFAHPASNKEDASYDYAYYDTDTGFSEYDHIEEFGKTKNKKA